MMMTWSHCKYRVAVWHFLPHKYIREVTGATRYTLFPLSSFYSCCKLSCCVCVLLFVFFHMVICVVSANGVVAVIIVRVMCSCCGVT